MIDENREIQIILKNALREDLNETGDITSQAIFSTEDQGCAVIRSKGTGVLSGAYLIEPLFELVDSTLKVNIQCKDGDLLAPAKQICSISGSVRSILTGERTILNLLQRLSGIATATSNMVSKIEGSKTRILDTRKTTPGLRILEKKAVVHGGGMNHRFGLFDMILIKDTHVKRAGGVREALSRALEWRGNRSEPKIEVEVQSVDEFIAALDFKADRIMLDNMTTADIAVCIEKRDECKSDVELEASGNVNLDTVAAIASTGVDFISSGAITHSAPALDIHLIMTSTGKV